MSDILDKLTNKVPNEGKVGLGQTSPADHHDLLAKFNEADLMAFARGVLSAVGKQAFGTLGKRELDLLVFHQLSKSSQLKDLTTYEWANLLRISEGRVRSLRSDSAMRFEVVDHKEALKTIARRFHNPNQTAVEYSKGHDRVRLLLDEPILQREFEYAVRRLGRIPDYSFNRNVLDVPVTTFIAVFLRNFQEEERRFKTVFNGVMNRDKDLKPFLDGDRPLSERFEVAWSKHSGKRVALTEIVKGVARVLALL